MQCKIWIESFSKYSPVRTLESASKQGTSSLVELFLKILRTFLTRGGRGTLLKPSQEPKTPERAPARERVDSVIVESDDEAPDAPSPRSPMSLRLEEESNESRRPGRQKRLSRYGRSLRESSSI